MTLTKTVKLSLVSMFMMGLVPAVAMAEDKVANIEVEADLPSAQDQTALEFFSTVQDDLKTSIASKVNRSEEDDAVNVDVAIQKLAFNGEPVVPLTSDFNEMEGLVTVSAKDDPSNVKTYKVGVVAHSGDQPAPMGVIVITPSTDDYYQAMIEGFASEVVVQLEEITLKPDPNSESN